MPNQFRIGIDGYNLALPRGTGVATYGRTLAETLHRVGHAIDGIYGIDAGQDPAMHEPLFFESLGRPPELTPAKRRAAARRRRLHAINRFASARAEVVPMSGRVDIAPLADRLPPFDRLFTSPDLFDFAMQYFGRHGRFLPLRMTDPPPIMHWTYPIPITLRGSRNVYTLHDIVPLRLPYTTLDQKARYRALVSLCIAQAARICTVSEASKADIVREFSVAPDRVVNTWQASLSPSSVTSAEADALAIRGIFGLPQRGYFLFLGAIEPKKNVGRLIEAYLSLMITTPLVIVGGKGWQSEQELVLLPTVEGITAAPGGSSHDGRIRMLSHLPRTLLMKLIRGARAVLFPSLSEGFGLPLLEAMQLGTPVLTSNFSSLQEIAGEAALLVDPYETEAIRAGIATLDQDEGLRGRLSAAGLVRAGFFSEARYIQRLEALYDAVLATPI